VGKGGKVEGKEFQFLYRKRRFETPKISLFLVALDGIKKLLITIQEFCEEVEDMAVSLKPATKASGKLKEMLNNAIAREIQVSIQYMWQHVQVMGVKGVAVQDKFKQTAIIEMKHAEKIAERLWYLEGTPTTKPGPIMVGESLKEFLELDVKAEEEAITMYKGIIEMAQKEGDVTTAFIFKEILEDEEEHHDLFTTMLEEV
jgi:bacterioferritin